MAITDRRQFGDDDGVACARLEEAARVWAQAGVDVIQVRERGMTDRDLAALVRRIMAATAGTPCAVVVNDRLDIALAAGAAGVHLPASGLPAARVRGFVPPSFSIGRSVHGPAEARQAEQEGGCDYLVLGTIFASRSKPGGHRVAGIGALTAACEAAVLPLLAVGGMTLDTASAAFAAGAAGLAAITLFSDPVGRGPAESGRARVADIVEALKRMYRAAAGRRAP